MREWLKMNIYIYIYIYQSNIAGNTTYDCQVIADPFNKYFLTIAEKINTTTVKSNSNPVCHLL